MFRKDMKIGQGEKYDVSSTSKEGITAEELATINKKKTKLIDIYKKFDVNNDGKLDKIELAMAMDGFTSVAGDDNKLSGKELNELAATFNETHGLDGENAVKGKDMKDFLKSVRNFTKDDTKESTAGIILDDMLATDAKNQGYAEVADNVGIYQKDGKYYQQSHGDGMINYTRVRQGDDGFVEMTESEITAEVEAEKLATINTKAQKDGFTVSEDGTYIKDNQVYVYDESNSQFVRAKQSEDGFVPMTEEDLAQEQADIDAARKAREEAERKAELANPTDYTVQNGESFRALIKRSLEAQGIEVTDEAMNDAIEDFKANNPGKLHVKNGVQYLYAGDVVKIAGGLEDKSNADEVKNAYRASIQSNEQSPSPVETVNVPEAPVKDEAPAENKATAVSIAGMEFVDGKSKEGYVLNNDGSISLDTGHLLFKKITYQFGTDGKIKTIQILQHSTSENDKTLELDYNSRGVPSGLSAGKAFRQLGGDFSNPTIIGRYLPDWAKPTSTDKESLPENPNIVPVRGVEANGLYKQKNSIGVYEYKQYLPVKGHGLCKFNPNYGQYEKFTGAYQGKYYENGQVKKLVKNITTWKPDKYGDSTLGCYIYPAGQIRESNNYKFNKSTDVNVEIILGDNRVYELAKGDSSGYAHWDYNDFLKEFVDSSTGAICAQKSYSNTYYLVRDNEKLPVTIDMETRALMVEINGKKYDMNDIMSGKVKI